MTFQVLKGVVFLPMGSFECCVCNLQVHLVSPHTVIFFFDFLVTLGNFWLYLFASRLSN